MNSKSSVKTVRLSTVLGGDIRLEASTYLREGYGFVRLANQCSEHVRLGDLAEIWQPSRLTGYTVPEGKGLPFLTAGQVFEDFPRVRKWLAKPFVPDADKRYVQPNWLLLSRSGVIGRVTAVYPHHLGKVITDDLLRVVPNDPADYGWLYAYMKTDFFQKVACAAQYGHMIKHIEVSHAAEFPVIMPEAYVRTRIGDMAVEAVQLRSQAWKLRDEAFQKLEECVGARTCCPSISPRKTSNEVRLSSVLQNRQRLDAPSYIGEIRNVDELIDGLNWGCLGELTDKIIVPKRFKHYYGNSNVPFVGISELYDVNAQPTKYIYPDFISNSEELMLEPGTLVLACSGQKYGILGRALMITENYRGIMGSNHLMRIYPNEDKLRAGYLLAFLNDPVIGRPSVVRYAFGTSVPELDPNDIKRVRIPLLEKAFENSIADIMEKSVSLSAKADVLEKNAIRLAQEQVEKLLASVSQ
jgi:hypothetical protein